MIIHLKPKTERQSVGVLYLCLTLVLGLVVAALTLAALSQANPARAATICVKPGGGDGCEATIMDALALAQEGDVVEVAAGEYTGYVIVTRTVTLEGGWAPDFSVRDLVLYTSTLRPPINTVNPQSVVSILGEPGDTSLVAPTLAGFEITGGRADLGSNHGGGLAIRNSDATVISNTIRDNRAFLLGGGIWVQNGAPHIEGNLIENNLIDGLGQQAYGGGIQLENSQSTVISNTIRENVVSGTIRYGGGLDIVGVSGVSLIGNLIISNTAGTASLADGYGGGLSVRGAPVSISGGQIISNSAGFAGGGIWSERSFTLVGGAVFSNTASYGGGIMSTADFSITAAQLSDNYAVQNGGAVWLTDGSLTISRTTLADNTAGGAAAGIDVSGTLEIHDSTIMGNRANTAAGLRLMGSGVLVDVDIISNTATSGMGVGGGIFNSVNSNLSLTGAAIVGNASEDRGGAVFNAGKISFTQSTLSDNSAGNNGGAIYNGSTAILNVYETPITANQADANQDNMGDGGGIYNMGLASIQVSTLFSNTAASFGGGIFNENILTLTLATLYQNQADDGGGLFAEGDSVTSIYTSTMRDNTTVMGGGAGINSNGQLTIQASTFSGNRTLSTNGNGGAILNNDVAEITNSTFSGNLAGGFGGGLRNAGTLTLTNVTIYSNTGVLGAGGIQNMDTTVLVNTALAANSPENCVGSMTSLGHNLEDGTACALGQPTDISNTPALLDVLGQNGGATATHALMENSPAIDAGDNAMCSPTDQRGAPRPVDGDGDGTAVCDIGAHEFGGQLPWIYLPFIRRSG